MAEHAVRGVSSYGSETSVSNTPISKLSFYLKCCSVGCGIRINLDPIVIDYNNAHTFSGHLQRIILETVLTELSPERLLNYVYYLDDEHQMLPSHASNAFFAIETVSQQLASFGGLHSLGQLQTHKIMLCTNEWLEEYYFIPVQTLRNQSVAANSTLSGPLPHLTFHCSHCRGGADYCTCQCGCPPVLTGSMCRVIHRGVSCFHCHTEIEGKRYKCASSSCANINMCQQCYESSVHDDTHPFHCYERFGSAPLSIPPRVTTLSGEGTAVGSLQDGENVPTAEAVPISEFKACEQEAAEAVTASTAAAAVSSAAQTTPGSFFPGQMVRLAGLATQHMNGKEALVISSAIGDNKIQIRLLSPGEEPRLIYSVKPENLVQMAGNATTNTAPVELT